MYKGILRSSNDLMATGDATSTWDLQEQRPIEQVCLKILAWILRGTAVHCPEKYCKSRNERPGNWLVLGAGVETDSN
jgi:hypothetical protein